ncbi:ankyrin-1-like [Chenopodium quinoa]|uniref:ankyrin-1-like n=1 Tax=Chenopodium quinoa TaxID=63459 RepID=UPI000B778098|nr:ankyrin-1-like [Chenopodium quinoa]
MANSKAVEMGKELYLAAANGDVEFLGEGKSNEYLLRKTYEKNNIIHIAIRHEQHDFIEACLEKFTINEIICGNSKENNPLHIAAEVGNLLIMSLLYDYIEERIAGYVGEKPWKVQNLRGNTPLHVAIIHENVNIGKFLLEKDPSLACIVNKSKEAPLHLAIKQHVNYTVSESIMSRVQQPLDEGGAALTIRSAPQEDMSVMIKLLVEKASNVTCFPDAKGLTPLHRVATLITPYNIQFTKLILDNCPQSAEVCDNTGKSILHLLINKIPNYHETLNLLNRKEMYALRNHQDHHGNTPLHVAAKNMDINMVRFLLESSAKLNINNMEGISAASAIQQQDVLQMLRKRILTREEIEATDKANIIILRERMSKLGMDFLLSQDSKGKNILHRIMLIKKESRVMLDDFVNFVEEALESFPSLIRQTDSKGDTPIHILVRNHPDTTIYVASGDQDNAQNNDTDGNPNYVFSTLWQSNLLPLLLEKCNQCILKLENEASVKGARFDSPWLMQNEDGNTALHEALKSNKNIDLVKRLLTYDQRSVSVVNKNKETPLHLFASRPIGIEQFKREDIKAMVDANVQAAYSPDNNGLTPLIRAIKAGNYSAAAVLCKASPEAAKSGDENCQTYGHLIVKHPSEYYFARLFQDKELRDLLELKDSNGNTPLHLAIIDNRFDLVLFFLEFWKEERKLSKVKVEWVSKLLEIHNKAGKTPNDLIAELPSLPSKIKKSILDEKEMVGVLSTWGIPSTEIKTYVNTIGIIAALLTTITFTTAFTVPGGLLENIGTPVLIKKIAFQFFMVLDILSMCLSMMVLCCLLWIMATNNRKNSVMILDFSVTLVLASFCTTLLTFMAGLCATTLPVKAWMAYVTLGLCTLLILLVYKDVIINVLIPSKNAIVIFVCNFLCSSCVSRSNTNPISSRAIVGADLQLPRQGSIFNV